MSGVTTLSAYHNNMKCSERGRYFHDILCTKLAWTKCTPVREYFLWAVRTGGMERFWGTFCLVASASRYLTRSPIYHNNNDLILPYYVLAFKMGKESCAQSVITAYAFPNLGVSRCCW